MNRKRALMAVLPMLGLLGGYLFCFWRGRLEFFGAEPVLLTIVLTGISLAMVVYRPIPVKIRSILVLYLVVFGLLADGLDFLLGGVVWEALHGSGLLVALASAGMLGYGLIHGRAVACKRYEIVLEKPMERPLRVGLLSDIHMGLCVDRRKLDGVCDALARENLDLLLLAGDLCDDYTSREDMGYALRRLGQVPAGLGRYCVFGNHDLASHGPALQYSETEYRQALAEADIRLLDDEAVVTEAVVLLGRRDLWMAENRGGRKPLRELLPREAQDKPILVLDHQPGEAREAAQAGADVQFSGHTHAGQVWPASWLGRVNPTFYGLHRFGKMALVVSSGLGGRGSRLRSGCSAEYVVLELSGKK